MNSRMIKHFVTAVFVISPTLASAHPGLGHAHDLAHGFFHPLGGLDHVLAMVAIGLLAAQLGGRALWLLPASFILAMVAGAAMGMSGAHIPLAETGIAFSVIALGASITFRLALPTIAMTVMAAFFAVFHGYAHGAEMPGTLSGFGYGIGFVAATALLHAAGIALGLAVDRISAARGAHIVQATGGAIALAGIAVLTGIV
jgi:urease accessory protein